VNGVGAGVRATAISLNLFIIHCFGDTFSPTVIGWISDRTNLRVALGSTLIFLAFSCGFLWAGAKVQGTGIRDQGSGIRKAGIRE
jgi:hypothetical protein